jgi:hypothetical protein
MFLIIGCTTLLGLARREDLWSEVDQNRTLTFRLTIRAHDDGKFSGYLTLHIVEYACVRSPCVGVAGSFLFSSFGMCNHSSFTTSKDDFCIGVENEV